MDEVVASEVAVVDKVRVHFHAPGSMKSFFEGVVRRVDVTTPNGCNFVVEVTHEIILDREHRVRPGFQDYFRYEDRNDFQGRIEVLSTPEQEGVENDQSSRNTGLRLVEVLAEITQKPEADHDQHLVHL